MKIFVILAWTVGGLITSVHSPQHTDAVLAGFFASVIIWMMWELFHCDPEEVSR